MKIKPIRGSMQRKTRLRGGESVRCKIPEEERSFFFVAHSKKEREKTFLKLPLSVAIYILGLKCRPHAGPPLIQVKLLFCCCCCCVSTHTHAQ